MNRALLVLTLFALVGCSCTGAFPLGADGGTPDASTPTPNGPGCTPFPSFPAPTGAACETYGGTPFTVASGVAGPTSIAADAHAIYWIAGGAPGGGLAIWKASRTGCGAVPLVSQVAPEGLLVVFGGAVYFLDTGYCPPGAACAVVYSVMKVPVQGATAPTVLATHLVEPVPTTLAVDASGAYWATRGSAANGTGAIFRVPLAGGTPEKLASAPNPQAIALDADAIYWTNGGIAANGYKDGAVMRLAKAGGAPKVLASFTGASARSLAVFAGSAWWIAFDNDDPTKGRIRSVDASESNPSVVDFADGQDAPMKLALDDTGVYWVNAGFGTWAGRHLSPTGTIVGTGEHGTCRTLTIADHLYAPVGLALGGNTLAWIEWGPEQANGLRRGTVKVMGLRQ